MEWKPFNFEEKTYDLTHLHPIEVQFTQEAKGEKPAITYAVDVLFGLHCFTRGAKADERPDNILLYSDSRETRIFDFHRYELSKSLPAIVQELVRCKCYHTGYKNFLTVVLADDEGKEVEYEIYFTVSKSARRGRLNLFIQSAYTRDEEHKNRPNRKPIRFAIILFNTLHDRPIREPK